MLGGRRVSNEAGRDATSGARACGGAPWRGAQCKRNSPRIALVDPGSNPSTSRRAAVPCGARCLASCASSLCRGTDDQLDAGAAAEPRRRRLQCTPSKVVASHARVIGRASRTCCHFAQRRRKCDRGHRHDPAELRASLARPAANRDRHQHQLRRDAALRKQVQIARRSEAGGANRLARPTIGGEHRRRSRAQGRVGRRDAATGFVPPSPVNRAAIRRAFCRHRQDEVDGVRSRPSCSVPRSTIAELLAVQKLPGWGRAATGPSGSGARLPGDPEEYWRPRAHYVDRS